MQSQGSIPEQGQLAVVRQRRYVVTDVRSGVSGAQIADQPEHLVSLTSIEDDALGKELQVIWEIEPGALPASPNGSSQSLRTLGSPIAEMAGGDRSPPSMLITRMRTLLERRSGVLHG